ncbi:MAG: indole acetimide hydrolase [Gammaproteobacteria bacterium]|nr:indole acetimide hydrolase [Gammaproteobacteria bacterium]
MSQELWRKPAHELAALIRAREVSSREVVDCHLARIEAVNGPVNAVTVTLAETARAAADQADRSEPRGPLHGVPFTIKENIDCTGSATTQGLTAMAAALPAVDAPVVERLKAAGAIPLARTNLPEMGLRIATDNALRGRTNNPWDLTRTCGGSSGGEGAALACGMSPLGLGNDIGGSLRNPAYCCGITALKPTTGRIPLAWSLAPNMGIAFRLMAVEGPMARSVADLRLALALMAGWHPRDPFSVSAPLQGPWAPRRAALATAIPGCTLPPATVAAIRRAGAVLRAAGWTVDEVTPPELERVNEVWGQILARDIEDMLPVLRTVMSAGAVATVEALGRHFDAAALPGGSRFVERDRLAQAWSAFFVDWPVVIGPTWTDLPFLHDADLDPVSGLDTTLGRLRFITPGNLLGLPAVALPMDVTDGLPSGVQIYAERWREDLCLEAASVIEAAVGTRAPIDPVI